VVAQSSIYDPLEVHAGGGETSMVLAKTPDLVHLDRLRKPERRKTSWDSCWWIMESLSDNGATGDPTRYDAEVGKQIIERMTEVLCDFLGDMWQRASRHQ